MSSILNIAHRGLHMNYPENTLEAFEAAIKLGIDGIELDVQETADNSFVVFHDDKLRGVAIKKLSLSDVKNVKLHSMYEIPTLEQALDLCRKRVKLLVDLKRVWSLVRLLVILKKEVEPKDIVVVSFHKELVSGISFLAPEVETALITSLPFPDPAKLTIAAQGKGVVVRCPFVNLKLVEEARAGNLSIFVWDCSNVKAAQKVMKLDIDGIITDFPDQVKEAAPSL